MWANLIYLVVGLVIGIIGGFFVTRFYMQRYLQKNPPINEDMIKALMQGMGRTPSQKQVNQLLKQMNRFNK
jgi:uncharacterized protein YneF (UPF0154 family)